MEEESFLTAIKKMGINFKKSRVMGNQTNISVAVMVATVFLSLLSCGIGLDTPATLASCNSSLTFDQDISSIVGRSGSGHCAQCHSGRYDNLSGIRQDRAAVIQSIKNGSMPPDNSNFKSSIDGEKLISWASCSTLK